MSESDTAERVVDGNDTPLSAHPDATGASSVGAKSKFVWPNVQPPEKFHPSGKNAAQESRLENVASNVGQLLYFN